MDQQQLRFSRVPAPTEDADEGSSTPKANNQQKQQLATQQQLDRAQPIPVEIPGVMRHVNSFGRMSAGSIGAAVQPPASAAGSSKAAGGSSSSSLKYDPLASKKKGGKAPAAPQQQQQPQQPPAVNGSNGAAAAEGNGQGLPHEDSSNSLNELIAGLDANVASHLDPANLPGFLRTPQRRDGDHDLPTLSH